MARYPLVIKIINLLVYIGLLGGSLYSATNDNPLYKHPTFISPAPFVFGVWGLIHFLLGGFVIYQFFGSAEELIVDGINWHFIGITLLNSLWLALWQYNHPVWAWIVILLTSIQVSLIYKILRQYHGEGSASINERVWVHAPFSLYHAWIFVIAVISTFAAFTHKTDDEKPSLLIKILTVIGLLVLESTAVGYIEALKGDVAGAIVIDWTLYGIAVEQKDHPVIYWTALVLAIITSFHILRPLYKRFVRGSTDETAPLLG